MGMMIFGFIVTGPMVLLTGLTTGPINTNPLIALAALGILGSGIAYMLNFRVIQAADATTASTVTYLTPVVAVLAGSIVLGEELSWNQPLGGVIVLLGAALAQGLIGSRRKPARA